MRRLSKLTQCFADPYHIDEDPDPALIIHLDPAKGLEGIHLKLGRDPDPAMNIKRTSFAIHILYRNVFMKFDLFYLCVKS